MVQDTDVENVRPIDRWLDGFGFTLNDLWRFPRETRWAVFCSVTVTMLLAMVHLLLAPAKYTATARVLIESGSVEEFMSKESFGGSIVSGMMQGQLERMRSNALYKLVLEDIGYATISLGLADADSLNEDEKSERRV